MVLSKVANVLSKSFTPFCVLTLILSIGIDLHNAFTDYENVWGYVKLITLQVGFIALIFINSKVDELLTQRQKLYDELWERHLELLKRFLSLTLDTPKDQPPPEKIQ